MNKKPEIYKPPINKKLNNNERVYYSNLKEEVRSNKSINREETPEQTLLRLNNSGSYIFNIGVLIKTKDKTYDTKIAGKIGNKLITLDGIVIPFNDIVSIIEK